MTDYKFKGTHILAEFYGIDFQKDTQKALFACLEESCATADVHILKIDTAVFENGGYTVYCLLKESHIAIHTYPEHQAAFLDVFTCGIKDTESIIKSLVHYYQPTTKHIKNIERGIDF